MNSKEFHLKNLQEALKFWETIPPEKVVEGLASYTSTCGTLHCFGGWLPHSPYFKELGVEVDPEEGHALFMQFYGHRAYYGLVGFHLFGVWGLFSPRQEEEAEGVSDHEIVKMRLQREIAKHGESK